MTTQEYDDDDFTVEVQSDSDDDLPVDYTPSTPKYAPTPTANDVPNDYTPSVVSNPPPRRSPSPSPIDYTPSVVSYSNPPPKRSPSPSPPQSPNGGRLTQEQFYRLPTPMREEFKRLDHEAFDHMPLYPADEPVHSQPKRRRTDHDGSKGNDNNDNLCSQQQHHHHETLTPSSSPNTASSSPSPIIPSPSPSPVTVSAPADLIRVYADHLDEPTKTAFVADATAIYGHRFAQALGDPALWTTTLARIAAHINTVDADIVLATVLKARRSLARPKNTGCLALDTLRRNFRNSVYNPVVSANNTIADKTKNFAFQFIRWGWTLHIVTSETHNGVRFDDPVTELYIQRPYQKPTKDNLIAIDCFGRKNTKLHYNIVTKTVVSKNAAVKVAPNATLFTDAARFKEAYP